MNNLDFDEILKKLSEMDKSELENNLKKAKHILDNSDINLNNDKK